MTCGTSTTHASSAPNGHGLMSVYSHILWGDFYLADYPMGYVIAYQIRKHLERQSRSPKEVERICKHRLHLYPESVDAWRRWANPFR